MNNTLVAVNFNNQALAATLVDNVPHVALKPICENLGLDWDSQMKRIKRHPVLSSTTVMITAVAQDGKLREMMMLPIKFLNGWLFGIDASRVNENAKEAVIKYQRECFEVLANHFMPKPNALRDLPRPNITGMEAAQLKRAVEQASKKDAKMYSQLYRKLYTAYGIDKYTNLPAGKLNEAMAFLGLKPVEMPEMVLIDAKELAELKRKPTSAWSNHATMILSSKGDADAIYLVRFKEGSTIITEQPENVMIGTPENIIRDLIDLGFVVIKNDPKNKLETIEQIVSAKFEA